MKSRFPFAKIAAALLCAAFSAFVSGCGGVYLNEKYELLDGTSPISVENGSGSKKSSEKKYALYVAEPEFSSFRNHWKSDAWPGNIYYSNSEMTESKVSDLKSKFTFTSKKMTESEIQSYLTFTLPDLVESTSGESITELLGRSRGYLAFCPRYSSSVKIVLKTEDENTMELTKVEDSGSLGMNIEWNNYGYVGDSVYIFVDGEYEKTASTSAGSATIDGLTSGSHSVVLKNGNSSDAVEISESKSVYLTLTKQFLLGAYNSGDGTALLTLTNKKYYPYNSVYIWVDGSYKTFISAASQYKSISLTNESHIIVLKDGSTSSAQEVSNRCSVSITRGDGEYPFTLSATKNSSNNSVTLSWTGSYDGDHVLVWKNGSCIYTNQKGHYSTTVSGLTAGSTYTFVLRANQTSGSPAISNSVTVTMPSSSSSSYTTLSVNADWVTGNIPSGTQSLVYRFYASAGTTYTVYWADSYRGTGSETLDVMVSAYSDSSFSSAMFVGEDSPTGQTISRATSGYVYLKVEPYTSGNTGTFKIKVSS